MRTWLISTWIRSSASSRPQLHARHRPHRVDVDHPRRRRSGRRSAPARSPTRAAGRSPWPRATRRADTPAHCTSRPAQRGHAVLHPAVEDVHVAQEVHHEGVGRDARTPRAGVPACSTRPSLHDDHLVGHFKGLFLVVRHEDAGDVDLVVQPPQPVPQLLPHLGVQGAERLVQQQHLRLDGQRPRQRHALPLAAGQLRRVALAPAPPGGSGAAARGRAPAPAASGRRRTRRAKAMFSKTVMWRNRA